MVKVSQVTWSAASSNHTTASAADSGVTTLFNRTASAPTATDAPFDVSGAVVPSFCAFLALLVFPDDGFTKAESLLYYQTIVPLLLPHLRGRPLILKAFPH